MVAGKATPSSSSSSLRSHDVDAAAPAASMFNIIYGAYVSCGISKVRYSGTVKDRVRVAGDDDAAATRCATSDSNSSSSRGARGGTVCDKNLGVTSQIIFNEMQEGSTGTGTGSGAGTRGQGSRKGGGACVARVPESALYTQRKYDKFIWNCFLLLLLLLLCLLPSLFSPSPPTTKCANESVERSWSEMRQLF